MFIPVLEEQRRDALVAYYLANVTHNDPFAGPWQLSSADDLYQYLLIDVQSESELETSRVAQAIASLQQYVHAVYNGMEPGYPSVYSEQVIDDWRTHMCEYAVWAANQMLRDYPENYLDPGVRIHATDLFKTLEGAINQSRISRDRVQRAVHAYLSRFEEVANLQVLTGYIDGEDFRQANYYFIGRQSVAPHGYYWRKAAVQLADDSALLSPTAWSEWQPINLPTGDIVTARPVIFNNRLHVIWVSRHSAEEENGPPLLTLECSYLWSDGGWSAPTTLGDRFEQEQVPQAESEEDAPLLKAYMTRTSKGQLLVVEFGDNKRLIDFQFQQLAPSYPVAEFQANELQHPVSADEKWHIADVRTIPGEGELSRELAMDFQLVGSDPERELSLVGKIERATTTPGIIRSKIGDANLSSDHIGIEIFEYSQGQPEIGIYRWVRKAADIELNMLWEVQLTVNQTNVSYRYEGVARRGYTSVLVLALASLDPALETTLLALSPEEIKAGTSFRATATLNGESTTYPPGRFANIQNYVQRTNRPLQRPFIINYLGLEGQEDEGKRVLAEVLTLNGHVSTRPGYQTITNAGNYVFEFGVDPQGPAGPSGMQRSIVEVVNSARSRPTLQSEGGGQFLNISALGLDNLNYIRLNTLFGRDLVLRAAVSLDALLHWNTQHIEEPSFPESVDPEVMDFKGANGRYFWELFFHLPHLAAHRLHQETDYLGAEQWLHYLFNPQTRIQPSSPPAPEYWRVRPLVEDGDPGYELVGLADPDAIAYAAPVHYRKAIFTFYVRNLMAYGDQRYRHLTRDSLNEAGVIYIRALSMMGPRPGQRQVSRWQPMTLNDAALPDPNLLHTSDQWLDGIKLPAVAIPLPTAQTPWLNLLYHSHFRLPVNTHLLQLWEDLDLRLDNLRNNRTLDGKPLHLRLYAAPLNPRDLLWAQAMANGSQRRGLGLHSDVPHYRFRALLPRVQNSIETLLRFGEQVRQYLEQRDRLSQEELLQGQALALSGFAISLQQQALEQALSSLQALRTSRSMVEQRQQFFSRLEQGDVSDQERRATDKLSDAKTKNWSSVGLYTGAAVAGLAPNIFGVANGGMEFAGPLNASGSALSIAAQNDSLDSNQISLNEQYRRRREEWLHQRDQASAELQVLDHQLVAQEHGIGVLEVQLEQASKAQAQAQEHYSFLKTRASNLGLYQWLLSQLSTLYFQAYDQVTSQCLALEASWQYEMGDYDSRFIQPNGWLDNYHGLTAGEALKLQVLRMETTYLRRHERRLELTKTVSLQQLLGAHWDAELEQLRERGELNFELRSADFDRDYPGHYLRQLVRVSVSIPAVLGPYQDIKAVLSQSYSATVIKADRLAMDYFYDGEQQSPPSTIVLNRRPSQSIGLSGGLDDHGLFNLEFGDERYYPFEGTGAVSHWNLRFPRHESIAQKQVLDSLTDIIVHIRYLAVDGGPQFAAYVNALVDQSDDTTLPPPQVRP